MVGPRWQELTNGRPRPRNEHAGTVHAWRAMQWRARTKTMLGWTGSGAIGAGIRPCVHAIRMVRQCMAYMGVPYVRIRNAQPRHLTHGLRVQRGRVW